MQENGKKAFVFKGVLTLLVIVVLSFLLIFHSNNDTIIVKHFSFGESQSNCNCKDSDGTRYVEENYENLDQHDPELIRYTRTRYLTPPPPASVPYHFNKPKSLEETDNGKWVRKYFKDKKNGIFIEAGANEGELHSHTLHLETDLNWTGLLIECNPTVTPYLRTKKRKAWVAGVCISTSTHPKTVNFSNPEKWSYSGTFGAAWGLNGIKTNWTYFDVDTVPLYSIIAAAGYTEIDFFSFDVEGVEKDIIKVFPFDEIRIKVMIIELYFLSQDERNELDKFLEGKGYVVVEKNNMDHYYVHKSVYLYVIMDQHTPALSVIIECMCQLSSPRPCSCSRNVCIIT